MSTWIKRIALALAVVVVAYVAVATWYVGKVSQREETWHDEAIANSTPATEADWFAAGRVDRPGIELRYRPRRSELYLVRIYDDGGYTSALHPGSSDVQPLRIETGSVPSADLRVLRQLAAALHAARGDVRRQADPTDPADARLTLVHENRGQVVYRYRTAEFATWPEPLRAFDARLYEAMRPWSVKPAHGYARPVPTLSYGNEAIPALVRGLESTREDLYASVVARLVNIGEPALPALTRVLREGAAARYRPASRYVAVVGGIGQLANASSEGYQLVQEIATKEATTPGALALQNRARQVVKAHERGAGTR